MPRSIAAQGGGRRGGIDDGKGQKRRSGKGNKRNWSPNHPRNFKVKAKDLRRINEKNGPWKRQRKICGTPI